MANVVDLTRTSIEQQARQWLIRMDGDKPLTAVEKEALKEWMDRSAFHAGELTRIARLWRRGNVMTALLAGLESQRGEQKAARAQAKRSTIRARWAWTILMAAAVVLSSVILVCCGLQPSDGLVAHTDETGIGEPTGAALSDGFYIRLNTNSQNEVAYSTQSPEPRLSWNEAFSSAKSDPNGALVAFGARRMIRALGTRFDVHLEEPSLEVSVGQDTVR